MLENIRVLYVEDDNDIAEEIVYFLKKRVKTLYVASNGVEGYAQFETYQPDLIITDLQMPKMNGLEMSKQIRNSDDQVPIIVVSAYNDTAFLMGAIDYNISGYLVKPVNLVQMLQSINKVLEPVFLRRQIQEKNSELETINTNLDLLVKEKTAALEHLLYHDGLTHLYNAMKLKEELKTGQYTCLVLLDISNFSIINKQYGKEFGDKVLIETAKALKQHTNKDIVLFKAESDRFIFLLQNSNETQSSEFAKQLISFFDVTDILIDSHPLTITFNIGIAPVCTSRFPVVNAEYALDICKEAGSRYFFFYDDEEENVKQAKEKIKWLDITKEMILKEKIVPYFQPIYNLSLNKITKYEVLARGEYEGDIIAPVYFLQPAEQLGLISVLTRMMIIKSFAFFQNNEYNFSLNITERDIIEGYLEEFLEMKMAMFKIHPSRLTLEVLETVTTTNMQSVVIERLLKLKAKGIRIAVDDFGVENSNFSRLINMDFDYIKLDGLFIRDLDSNEKGQTIVRAIVQLAHTLGIKTIAEFVENVEVCKIVKSCGVDFVQGYFIGKPEAKLLDTFTCKEDL